MKIKTFALTCTAACLISLNIVAAEPAQKTSTDTTAVSADATSSSVTSPNVANPAVVSAAQPQTTQGQASIEKININTASAEQLAAALNGIGQKKAEAIVQFREQNGPFKSVEEISQVKGIGEATVAKNKDKISIE